jgi:hypothetical protein
MIFLLSPTRMQKKKKKKKEKQTSKQKNNKKTQESTIEVMGLRSRGWGRKSQQHGLQNSSSRLLTSFLCLQPSKLSRANQEDGTWELRFREHKWGL